MNTNSFMSFDICPCFQRRFWIKNVGIFGAKLTLNIFDWGKRQVEIGQRFAQQSQAEENLARIDMRIGIEIDNIYRMLERSKKMVEVTREALSLCRENTRLNESRRASFPMVNKRQIRMRTKKTNPTKINKEIILFVQRRSGYAYGNSTRRHERSS